MAETTQIEVPKRFKYYNDEYEVIEKTTKNNKGEYVGNDCYRCKCLSGLYKGREFTFPLSFINSWAKK